MEKKNEEPRKQRWALTMKNEKKQILETKANEVHEHFFKRSCQREDEATNGFKRQPHKEKKRKRKYNVQQYTTNNKQLKMPINNYIQMIGKKTHLNPI